VRRITDAETPHAAAYERVRRRQMPRRSGYLRAQIVAAVLQYCIQLQPRATPAALAQCIPVSLIGMEEMINACLDRHCTQQLSSDFERQPPLIEIAGQQLIAHMPRRPNKAFPQARFLKSQDNTGQSSNYRGFQQPKLRKLS